MTDPSPDEISFPAHKESPVKSFAGVRSPTSNISAISPHLLDEMICYENALRTENNANAFRVRLADTIRAIEDSGEIQRRTAEVIAKQFGVGRVSFAMLEPDGVCFTIRQEFAGDSRLTGCSRHPVARFGKALAEERGRTVVVENVESDARLSAEEKLAYARHGIASVIRIRLRSKNRPLAALVLADSQARHWSRAELDLMEEAAERVWSAIERAEAEEAFHALHAQLIQADLRKNEFLAMLGHELRNPLAAAQNAVQLLGGMARDAESQKCLRILQRQTQILRSLVDELLDVSRVTRGAIALKKERVDLLAVATHALESALPLFEEKQQHITTRFTREPTIVLGDSVRLEQILINLLNNAAKYTDTGGCISLQVEASSGYADIRVRDSGIGIAPEKKEAIFELFGQVEPGIDRSQGGLGIGLTIAETLVELHGGRIAVHSDGLGRGAEFKVTLPLVAQEAWNQAVNAPAAPMHHESKRILLVEDNPDIADTLGLLLREVGHQVAIANNGFQALEAAEASAPDVVLLDIGLPGMSGFDVARRLRQNSNGRTPSLVALTGYGQDSDRKLAREAGFDGYFVKPIRFEELNAFISAQQRQ